VCRATKEHLTLLGNEDAHVLFEHPAEADAGTLSPAAIRGIRLGKRVGSRAFGLVVGGFGIPDTGLAPNSVEVQRGLSSLPGVRPG